MLDYKKNSWRLKKEDTSKHKEQLKNLGINVGSKAPEISISRYKW